MRILNRYIARDFTVTFGITLLVFVFVMALINSFKAIDLFSRGVSGLLVLQVFSYGMPFSLIFAIPMSVLATAFLLYSRMASDREVTAMKACGISVWQMLQTPLFLSSLLCLVCVYINCTLAPHSHFERRKVLGRLGIETPLSLLDEGRYIRDFPGFTLYIGHKEPDGRHVRDITVYQFGERGPKQTIRAKTGVIEVDPDDRHVIVVTLYQVTLDEADEQRPDDLALMRHVAAAEYPLRIDVRALTQRETVWKKRADLSMTDLVRAIHGTILLLDDELTDVAGLAARLRDPEDGLMGAWRGAFAERTRRLLAAAADAPAALPALRSALTEEFNRLIVGPSLYAPDLFGAVALNDKTARLLAQAPRDDALRRLNRMVLEDVFPGLIARNLLSNLYPEDMEVHRMSLLVEASTRLALSFSCFAFMLLGAALGIKIHRKENSIGIAVTLGLVFIFYFFISVADALVSRPWLQPHLIVWIPFILSEAIGLHLLRRAG